MRYMKTWAVAAGAAAVLGGMGVGVAPGGQPCLVAGGAGDGARPARASSREAEARGRVAEGEAARREAEAQRPGRREAEKARPKLGREEGRGGQGARGAARGRGPRPGGRGRERTARGRGPRPGRRGRGAAARGRGPGPGRRGRDARPAHRRRRPATAATSGRPSRATTTAALAAPAGGGRTTAAATTTVPAGTAPTTDPGPRQRGRGISSTVVRSITEAGGRARPPHAARTVRGGQVEPAPRLLRCPPDDVQAEPGGRAAGPAAVEQRRILDPGAGVLHDHRRHRPGPYGHGEAGADRACGRRRCRAARPPRRPGRPRRHRHRHRLVRHLLAVPAAPAPRPAPTRTRPGPAPPRPRRHRAGLPGRPPRLRDDVADHPLDAGDGGEHPLRLVGIPQALGVQPQRGQRRPQPVRQVGGRLPLLPQQVLDPVGQPVERVGDPADLGRVRPASPGRTGRRRAACPRCRPPTAAAAPGPRPISPASSPAPAEQHRTQHDQRERRPPDPGQLRVRDERPHHRGGPAAVLSTGDQHRPPTGHVDRGRPGSRRPRGDRRAAGCPARRWCRCGSTRSRWPPCSAGSSDELISASVVDVHERRRRLRLHGGLDRLPAGGHVPHQEQQRHQERDHDERGDRERQQDDPPGQCAAPGSTSLTPTPRTVCR